MTRLDGAQTARARRVIGRKFPCGVLDSSRALAQGPHDLIGDLCPSQT